MYFSKKSIIAIMLSFLMCFNTFSAIVSDNDGSAFVTKAEFDALKKNFASQIDQYNQSIDGKIDGSIAQYLAGLQIFTAPDDLISKVNEAVGGRLWFKNTWPGVGVETLTTNFKCDATRHYTYKYFNNVMWSGKMAFSTGGYLGSAITAGWDPAGGSSTTQNNRLGYAEYNGNGGLSDGSAINWNGSNYFTALEIKKGYTWEGSSKVSWNKLTTTYDNVTNKINISDAGSGSGWVVETKPSGRRIIKQWCNSMYPSTEIEIVSHTYKDRAPSKDKNSVQTYSVTLGGYGDTSVLTKIEIPKMTTWGVKEDGTKITNQSTTASGQYYSISQLMTKSSDGIDYSLFMWGKNASKNIYYQDENILPTASTTVTTQTADKTASDFTRIYYPPESIKAGKNTLSGQEFTYYPISVKNTLGNAGNLFSNDYVSTVAGENVKIGSGVPLIEINDKDQNVSVEINFECRNSSGTVVNDKVHYIVSDMKLNNGAAQTDAQTFASGSIQSTNTLTFNVTGVKGKVWINIYAETDGNDASIKDMTCR